MFSKLKFALFKFCCRAVDAMHMPILVLGKYLHIGKGTAYGLGKYEIIPDGQG